MLHQVMTTLVMECIVDIIRYYSSIKL